MTQTRNVLTAGMLAAAMLFATLLPGAVLATSVLELPTVAGLELGALVKSADSSTVYYFGADEKRYGFPDEGTYFTWYDDFDDVQTITSEEVSAIPFGGMVTYRPQTGDDLSTRLLQIAGNPAVYVGVGNGMLVALGSANVAEDLFGSNWADYIDVLPDAFVGNYTIVSGVITANNAFQDFEDYTISDDKELEEAVDVAMYGDPLRFAGFVEGSCGDEYCAYNEVTVQQGDTVKFVNWTGETITVRGEENAWTTGAMENEAITVLTITSEPGEYTFYADENDSMVGTLIVE